MNDAAFIGIDVGTSSVKALLSGPDGIVFDSHAAAHAMNRPVPGAAEQDPMAWMRHVEDALSRFAAHPMAGRVTAIGITSQVNTHVFCDASLSPLYPALTWQDTRPARQAAQLERSITIEDKVAALGAPIPIDASHALSRMAWMAETQPEPWKHTAHVLLPKDFVIARLTGVIAADPISSVGLVGMDHRYAPAITGLVPRAQALLPTLADPLTIVGTVRNGLPFAGVPVAAGTMDAWASMFGLGVAAEGEAMYLSGTSEVLGLISARRDGAPGIITFPDWNGITLHAAPTQSGGASLAWLSRLVGQEPETLARLGGTAGIRRESPLFLPHLDGERAPLWDPQARAAFAGLSGATGLGDLVASVMEGVAFQARMAIEALETSGARTIARLRHGGGGARSDVWCQIRADAIGRTLDRVRVSETAALGAIVMAGVANGTVGNLQEATRALVTHDRDFVPDPAACDLADARYARFKDLYKDLRPLNGFLTAER